MSYLNQITVDELVDRLVSTIHEVMVPKIHSQPESGLESPFTESTPPKISYSIPEFCEMTSLGRSTVYEMLASKRLPARKCGSRTIITHADAISFIQSLPIVGEDA